MSFTEHFYFHVKFYHWLKINIYLFIQVSEVAPLLKSLSFGETSWSDTEAKFPKFEQQQTTQS